MAGGADRVPWELEVWLDRVSAVEGTRRYSVDQGLGRKVRIGGFPRRCVQTISLCVRGRGVLPSTRVLWNI